MKKILQHPVFVITIVVLAAIAVGAYAYFSISKHPQYKYTQAVIKNVTESVKATGQVKPAESVGLAFERAGKISWVGVSVGDKVTAGQALTSLNSQDALADVASAKAALALAQAQAGLQDTGLVNAQSNLTEAQKSMLDKIQNAYFVSDDAVRTEANPFFANPSTENPTLNLNIPNQQLSINLQNERRNLEQTLINWNNEINQASAATSSVDWVTLSGHARQNILAVKTFLDDIANALNIAVSNPGVSDATLAGWKLSITTSRGSVSGALIALSGADSGLSLSQSAYNVAEQQVQSSGSDGSTTTSLSQAQIDAAQANLDKANSALTKTVLRAPFDGVVSSVDAKVGQTVAVGTSLINEISSANYQIEGYVSESDAAKINIGQVASTTLDAYGSTVDFPVKVVLVDPAATIQNGVSSYKVTFEFVGNDSRVKAGMTANVSVFVASKQGVLTVPDSAIVRRGVDEDVLVSPNKNGTAVLRKVTTGLVGDDGSVEIISGLTPYDFIVN